MAKLYYVNGQLVYDEEDGKVVYVNGGLVVGVGAGLSPLPLLENLAVFDVTSDSARLKVDLIYSIELYFAEVFDGAQSNISLEDVDGVLLIEHLGDPELFIADTGDGSQLDLLIEIGDLMLLE